MVNYQSTLDAMPKGILVSRIYAQYNCKSGKISSIPERGIRKIALKIAYDGRVYHGVQKDPNGLSIGEVLENALRSTDLYIESNDIVFCGRTDRGVSAANMIISLKIKSILETYSANPNYHRHIETETYDTYQFNKKEYKRYLLNNSDFEIKKHDAKELPYDLILNKVLPPQIRVKGWAPVPWNFSARHNCCQRRYTYFFTCPPQLLPKYQEAGRIIYKTEDFYNFCTHSKVDANYKFKLSMLEFVSITPIPSQDTKILCAMNISAYSFLHNMVRKIFSWCERFAIYNNSSVENIEPADPQFLVFMDATFTNSLHFIDSTTTKHPSKDIYTEFEVTKHIYK